MGMMTYYDILQPHQRCDVSTGKVIGSPTKHPTSNPTPFTTPHPTKIPIQMIPTKHPTEQCLLGSKCKVHGDCCPNNVNPEALGIACSSDTKLNNNQFTKKDFFCCILKGNHGCLDNLDCCSKKTKCNLDGKCVDSASIASTTPFPTKYPAPSPTLKPTKYPTPEPTENPALKPTPKPIDPTPSPTDPWLFYRCDDKINGDYNDQKIKFNVQLPSGGNLMFDARQSGIFSFELDLIESAMMLDSH